ncbi:MAG: thiamine pyrophosphate-binding protein [Alphaproteobacteria bacterium]
MSVNAITGRSAFLALLKDEGVTHLFGNPGTTELPIMDALREHQDLNYVLGLQESVVVYMADGYARASGELVSCNVHVAPGLGNAIGAIYGAQFANVPMIVTAGQQEQGHGLTEPLLYAPLVPIAEPVVKWATEINRLEDLPRVMHRAAKVAMAEPKGPVFISLPGDILNDEGGIDLGHSTRVEQENRPSDAVLEKLADRLLKAERPVIVSGDEIVSADAFDEVAQLAEALGAPAWQQTVNSGAHFPSRHPAYMGSLNRDQKWVRSVMAEHDLLVVVGADVLRMSVYSEVEPLPEGMAVVQIGLRDWEMGKNFPTELAVQAHVRETLKALIPLLAERGGEAHADRAAARLKAVEGKNWTAKRKAAVERAAAKASQNPISGDYMMYQIAESLPDNAVVVNEGLTTANTLLQFLPFTDKNSYYALTAGGIGWGIAAAVGAAAAKPDRPLVAIIGDGSAMYSIQALWTAANRQLPITYVICNNMSYRIIKQRLKAFHGNEHFVGMDFDNPKLDFVGLANSMGMQAKRITDPADIAPAIKEATASGKPMLLDVMVEKDV